MAHRYATAELKWRKAEDGYALHLGRSKQALVSVVPDAVYPGMWRMRRADGSLTDMSNISWAKDAALSIALGVLNHHDQTGQPGTPAR